MAAISWTSTPVMAKITLPSGNSYFLKDADVRAWIGDGSSSGAEKRITDVETAIAELQNATHWLGITSSAISDGSTLNPIVINGDNVTAVNGDIVQDGNGTEYIFNGNLTTAAWQQFGASIGTLKAFAYVDEGEVTIKPKGSNAASAVTFSGGTTDKVLGEATTFTNGSSSVSFADHTTATVLKSDVTATVPKTSSTVKYLQATIGNTAVGVATDGSAITSITPTTGDFVTSYPGATKKLATTSITPFGSAGTAPSWTGTVANETLTIGWNAGTQASAGSAVTVATGKVASTDTSGDSVMTGLGTASKSSAVTGLGTPATDTFAKTIEVVTQPTITLTEESSTSTGRVPVVTAVSTSGTNNVTFATSGHTASAITALGAATAAAQTITVGTNDKVTAVTSIGTGTAAAQTFTGTQETLTVSPKSGS